MNIYPQQLQQARAIKGELLDMFLHLHRHPELSFEEFETTRFIKDKLERLGLELIDTGMPTGAVAVLRGAEPGRTIAIRADIDAIPETEASGRETASEKYGVMHGCGHDLHITSLYGAAKLLSGMKDSLRGNVVFIFQPAEEITRGAKAMVEHGLLERLPARPEAMFSLHSYPFLPAGKAAVESGALMAGKIHYIVNLQGKSGHGGFPHHCIDVIVAGAAIINGVQTIVSRNTDPFEPLVCGVCSVHAGDADFFITDKMRMTGAIRCLNEETLERSVQRLQDLINATAQAYNCSARIELIREVPPLVNDPALTALARSAAEQILGKENIEKVPPMLGSDDLAVFGKYMPVFYYFLGTGFKDRKNASLHSPEFCLNYEALPFGPALLAQSAALALERESTTSP